MEAGTEPHELRNRLLTKRSVCGDRTYEEGECGEGEALTRRGQKGMMSAHKQ